VTNEGAARGTQQRTGSYFFLSYAHSRPLEGDMQANRDQSVRRFFRDLTKAVKDHASPRSRLTTGFFDQDIPPGSDWKASLSRAIGAAAVFVPLYSPTYFTMAWPGREWACFHERLVRAGLNDPSRWIAPVLWTPLQWAAISEQDDPPGLDKALAVGASEPEYQRNGLRALLNISHSEEFSDESYEEYYKESYNAVVDKLATQIVVLAEKSPLDPSTVPDIERVKSQFRPKARLAIFDVRVAAPTLRTVPSGRDPHHYGGNSTEWRPYPRQKLSLAEYAKQIAERLDFHVELAGIERTGDPATPNPGIILIDPWFISGTEGLRRLRAAVSDLPPWVLPLLVLSPPDDRRTEQLAEQVRNVLGRDNALPGGSSRHLADSVSSLREFVSVAPVLVAEAERQYFRHSKGPAPLYEPRPRPRLSGSAQPDAQGPTPLRRGKKPDA